MTVLSNPTLRVDYLQPGQVAQAPGGQPEEVRGDSLGGAGLFLLCTAALAVALLYRLYLLLHYYSTPDADQTIVGLMARHIEHGERPVFYWGQPYTGSADGYITAFLFSHFGQSDTLLHVAPMVASLAFTLLTIGLGWRLYGVGVASFTAIYLALGPALLIDWSFWAGSGYLEVMALGTAALLLALPPASGKASRAWLRLPLAFLLLGFGLWVQPLALAYLLAVLALLAGRAWATVHAPPRLPTGMLVTAVSLAAFVAGMWPLLQYNLAPEHPGETLTFLTQRAATHLDALTVFSRVVLWAGPVVLGLAPPTTDRAYFERFLLDHLALYGVALGVVLFVLFWGVARWRDAWQRLRTLTRACPSAELGLLVLSIVVVIAYLVSSWGAEDWSGSQPRYLLPLYTALPLVMRGCLPRRVHGGQWTLAFLVVVGLTACTVYVNGTTFARDDLRPLAHYLEEQGVTAVYGDYWMVYPLLYDSDERLSGVAVNDDLTMGRNRYSPYLRAAAASRHYAWVVGTGSARQHAVLVCLELLHSHYTTLIWRNQTIYDAPTGRAFPWGNGGRCPTVGATASSAPVPVARPAGLIRPAYGDAPPRPSRKRP